MYLLSWYFTKTASRPFTSTVSYANDPDRESAEDGTIDVLIETISTALTYLGFYRLSFMNFRKNISDNFSFYLEILMELTSKFSALSYSTKTHHTFTVYTRNLISP